MEGCSKYCSFCVVPYTRGEEISRPFDDVLAEMRTLAEQGVREVNLLGRTSMPTAARCMTAAPRISDC
jgi:tRNA-2-methylthio-N6-dimethylallyladenosine synthase